MARIDNIDPDEDFLANLDADFESDNEEAIFLSSLIRQPDMSDMNYDNEMSRMWGCS